MRTILVVDDDDDTREGFAELLRDAGYQVQEAENGRAALATLEQRNEPCLVLLDLMMPVMNGPAFLEAIRRTNRDSAVKVVALSASDAVHQVPQVDGFLPKPILPEHLLELVERYCEPTDPRAWVS